MGSDSCLWRLLNRSIIHQLWVEEDKRKGHFLNWASSHTFRPLAGKGAVDDVANWQIYSYAGAMIMLQGDYQWALKGRRKMGIPKSMTLPNKVQRSSGVENDLCRKFSACSEEQTRAALTCNCTVTHQRREMRRLKAGCADLAPEIQWIRGIMWFD